MMMLPDDGGATAPVREVPPGWCDVVGDGRMGRALSAALRAAGVAVRGPLARGADAAGAMIVLLCVPDREIASASAAIADGGLVGHVSASADLSLLAPHERFALHPLLSVVGASACFEGATCVVEGSTARATEVARDLATRLGMTARVIAPEQRALYHAAATMASNYLVTLEAGAERLARLAGLDRAALVPLVHGSVEQWAALGARDALTGPIARGDEETVTRQRAAVAAAAPDMVALWDCLVTATRSLAAGKPGVAR